MRWHRVIIYVLVLVVAVVLLLGCLALWIYLPFSGKSSRQIAVALLAYHDLTQTNGLGYLGTDLSATLDLYNQDWNGSHFSGADFAEATYSYDRLGIYFERTFILRRDFPGGSTWTLSNQVRSCFPINNYQRRWTQRFITITSSGSTVTPYNDKNPKIASDAVTATNLAGSWQVTEWASNNGWNEDIIITTNGNCTCIHNAGVGTDASKDFGTVQVKNGFLIITITNREPHSIPIPPVKQLRIVYADKQNILLTLDTYPAKYLFRKEVK